MVRGIGSQRVPFERGLTGAAGQARIIRHSCSGEKSVSHFVMVGRTERGSRLIGTTIVYYSLDPLSQSVVVDRSPSVIRRSLVVTSAVCVAVTLLAGPIRAADKSKGESRIDFSRTIRPLLANKCLKCHGPGGASMTRT